MKSDMGAVVRVMQLPDSGLEIRDRMWLKITIANAVIGEGPTPGGGARSLPDLPTATQASSPGPLQGARPCSHPDFRLWPPDCARTHFPCFKHLSALTPQFSILSLVTSASGHEVSLLL